MNSRDEFLLKAAQAAKDAGHIWPGYAAAEAALESAWGTSHLAIEANNLFGRKASHGVAYTSDEIITLPTKEFFHGQWITVSAQWLKFPDWSACLHDRMALLESLPSLYEPALSAPDGPSFVKLVSQHWSTDPARADKVLETYNVHQGVLNGY